MEKVRNNLAYLYFNSSIVKRLHFTDENMINKYYTKFVNTIEQVDLTLQGDETLEKKSIVAKIFENILKYCNTEKVPKNSIETILLTGGSLQLDNLSSIIKH